MLVLCRVIEVICVSLAIVFAIATCVLNYKNTLFNRYSSFDTLEASFVMAMFACVMRCLYDILGGI
jgi:hypothetical protein